MKKEVKKCIFAGTFDPPTLGHKAVIDTCLKMFDVKAYLRTIGHVDETPIKPFKN